jgi:hypothetical protein
MLFKKYQVRPSSKPVQLFMCEPFCPYLEKQESDIDSDLEVDLGILDRVKTSMVEANISTNEEETETEETASGQVPAEAATSCKTCSSAALNTPVSIISQAVAVLEKRSKYLFEKLFLDTTPFAKFHFFWHKWEA